jgi:hypothetical protein
MRHTPRLAPALVALLPLLSASCGGDSASGGDGTPAVACSVAYAGGATETVWCDTPVVRSNGSGGYVLWIMAFRGPRGLGAEQAGQVTVTIATRPVIGVDYAFGSGIDSGFETRTAGGVDTHEAVSGSAGSFSVRFSTIPATDGPDPTGFEGIGTIHGTFTATLVPIAGGTDVTASGTF